MQIGVEWRRVHNDDIIATEVLVIELASDSTNLLRGGLQVRWLDELNIFFFHEFPQKLR